MAKQSGLGDRLYIDGFDYSGDIGSLSGMHGGPAALDETGIDKSAMERIGGKRDGGLSFTSFFNPSAGRAHVNLKTLPLTDRIATYFRGTVVGSPAASCIGKQINFDPTRGDDGSLTTEVEIQANAFGLEWGEQLTAGRQVLGSAGNGTALDYGAAIGTTLFGLQAYVHCFAFTGTSATVNIQCSSDNGADAYATVTGASSTAITAVGSQRIETGRTATVERFVKVNVSGTFSNFDFAVVVTKNLTSTVF